MGNVKRKEGQMEFKENGKWLVKSLAMVCCCFCLCVSWGCARTEEEGTQTPTAETGTGQTGTTITETAETEAVQTGAEETGDEAGTENQVSSLTAADNLNFRGYDVVYVIDNSRSVWKQQEARNQAVRYISNLAVGSDIRIGAVYFADHLYGTLGLTSMLTREGSQTVLDFLDMKQQDEGNIDTNIGTALEAACSLFENQDSSRERIVILFSDGINENLAQSRAYAEAANRKTEEQTARLAEMGVSIYCVYLQKNRNDEDYLKSIVNYFQEENTYDEERFSKVTEENISDLNDVFIDVFYQMQKNMKFRRIYPDTTGHVSFFVPALGIERLLVYLNGELEEGSHLYPPRQSECTNWTDGSARFLAYEDPVPGNWEVEVVSSDLDAVVGTIAMYPNLKVRGEIVKVSDENDPKYKGARLILHCYDGKGQEVALDELISVKAQLLYTESNAAAASKQLKMEVVDGKAQSEVFLMDFYGDYSFRVNLSYDDYIDLDYTIKGGTVAKSAPVVTPVNKWFLCEKTEAGFTFSIQESDLFDDPEGDQVFVVNVIQLKDANPASVNQSPGSVQVTVPQTGRVNFILQLSDSSGMAADVEVKGRALDGAYIRKNVIWAVIFALLTLMGIILYEISLKIGKKQKAAHFQRLEELGKEFDEFYGGRSPEKHNELWMEMYFLLEGDENMGMPGLRKMSAWVSEEELRNLGVEDYVLQKPADKDTVLSQNHEKKFEELAKRRKSLAVKARQVLKDPVENWNNFREMKDCLTEMEKVLHELQINRAMENRQYQDMEEAIKRMDGAVARIEKILSAPICCDLTVLSVEGMPGAEGMFKCRNLGGEFRKGFYSLDQVNLLGYGRLGDCLGETKIRVSGFQEEREGLLLQAAREVTCRCLTEEGGIQKGRKAVLLEGMKYELELTTEKGLMILTVSVKQG